MMYKEVKVKEGIKVYGSGDASRRTVTLEGQTYYVNSTSGETLYEGRVELFDEDKNSVGWVSQDLIEEEDRDEVKDDVEEVSEDSFVETTYEVSGEKVSETNETSNYRLFNDDGVIRKNSIVELRDRATLFANNTRIPGKLKGKLLYVRRTDGNISWISTRKSGPVVGAVLNKSLKKVDK